MEALGQGSPSASGAKQLAPLVWCWELGVTPTLTVAVASLPAVQEAEVEEALQSLVALAPGWLLWQVVAMGEEAGRHCKVALVSSPVKWLALGTPTTVGVRGGCIALLWVEGLMLALGMAHQPLVVMTGGLGAVGGLVHQPLVAARGTAGMGAEAEAGPLAVAGVAAGVGAVAG